MLCDVIVKKGVGEDRSGLEEHIAEVSAVFAARVGGGKAKGGKGGKGGKKGGRGRSHAGCTTCCGSFGALPFLVLPSEDSAREAALHEPLEDLLRGSAAFTSAMCRWMALVDYDCRRLHDAFARHSSLPGSFPKEAEARASMAAALTGPGAAGGASAPASPRGAVALVASPEEGDTVPGIEAASAGEAITGVGGWVLDGFPALPQEVVAVELTLQGGSALRRVEWLMPVNKAIGAVATGELDVVTAEAKSAEDRKTEVEAAAAQKGKKGKDKQEVDVDAVVAARVEALQHCKYHGLDLVVEVAGQGAAKAEALALRSSIHAKTSTIQQRARPFIREDTAETQETQGEGGGEAEADEGEANEQEAAELLPEGHVKYPFARRTELFNAGKEVLKAYYEEGRQEGTSAWGSAVYCCVPGETVGETRAFGIADEAVEAWDLAQTAERSEVAEPKGSEGEGEAEVAGEAAEGSANSSVAKEDSGEESKVSGGAEGEEAEAGSTGDSTHEGSGEGSEAEAEEPSVVDEQTDEPIGSAEGSSGPDRQSAAPGFNPQVRASLLRRALRRGLTAGDDESARALLRRWTALTAAYDQGVALVSTATRTWRHSMQHRLTWALRTFVKELRRSTVPPPPRRERTNAGGGKTAALSTAAAAKSGTRGTATRGAAQGSVLMKSKQGGKKGGAASPSVASPGSMGGESFSMPNVGSRWSLPVSSMGELLPAAGDSHLPEQTTLATAASAAPYPEPLTPLAQRAFALEEAVAAAIASLLNGNGEKEKVSHRILADSAWLDLSAGPACAWAG